MKRLLQTLLLLLILNVCVNAQNLVINPSLEEMTECPFSPSQIPFPSASAISVNNWTRPTDATSDYFNSCAAGPFFSSTSTPENFAGYQEPKEGNGYAGGYVFFSSMDYREYIQAPLFTPLTAGHKYFISYYTSLANGMGDILAIDQMGACFLNLPEERVGYLAALTDLIPQVYSEPGVVLSDTLNWMNISGAFTATGGEEWVIVGNFTPDEDLTLEPVGPPAELSSFCYYYFDDFCLLDMTAPLHSFQTDTTICPDSDLLISGPDDQTYYYWNDGTTSQQRPVTETGKYWVASADIGSCTSRVDTINVIVAMVPQSINLGNDTVVCKNNPILLDAADEAFTLYRWSTGEQTSSILAAYPGVYYVTASSDCYLGTDTIVISTPSIPNVELPADAILCTGTELSLGVAMGNLQYQWNTGQDVCCINVSESGDYILTATNICGESDSDAIAVRYSECDHCILAPTAFTPNGDGLNDQFRVTVRCEMKNYSLMIFSRWGQTVFATTNINDGWDGYINGSPANVGVYFYYIEGEPAIETIGEIKEKGDITLIR